MEEWFAGWFRSWLSRHPLKGLLAVDRAHYTAEVMARVKGLPRPVVAAKQVPRFRWWSIPRLALAAPVFAAGLTLVVVIGRGAHQRLAKDVAHQAQVLASLEGPGFDQVGSHPFDVGADEVEAIDTLTIAAESVSDEEAWIHTTLQLLEQFEEAEPILHHPDVETDEEWLHELERLDQVDLS